ncbi:hypothetical protein HUJ04_011617 [Dendroctonus ponderosae]|nr:hypothetical protein HUJ04_011617 [Dendroctonus ponderosae]
MFIVFQLILRQLTENRMEMAVPATLTIEQQMDRTICKVCSTTFSKFSNLATHVKRKHPVPKKARTGSYVCEECGERFIRLSGLNQHMQKKHPSGLWKIL